MCCFLTACVEEGAVVVEPMGEEGQRILNYADPVVDDLLQAFNEAEYEEFSRYFDENMKSQIRKSVFLDMRDTLVSKMGLYQSRALALITREGSYEVVFYSADFEKEENVQVKVVFKEFRGERLISGLNIRFTEIAGSSP